SLSASVSDSAPQLTAMSGCLSALAVSVKCVRHQLFSSSAFSLNQHRRLVRTVLNDQPAKRNHGRTASDQLVLNRIIVANSFVSIHTVTAYRYSNEQRRRCFDTT